MLFALTVQLPQVLRISNHDVSQANMTSSNAKVERLKESILSRARDLIGIDTSDPNVIPPAGAVLADEKELSHNNTYGRLPRFYIDKVVTCRHCGTEEVWTAERQKWWYETTIENINANAVLCRECREQEKLLKEEARRIHLEGLPLSMDRACRYHDAEITCSGLIVDNLMLFAPPVQRLQAFL